MILFSLFYFNLSSRRQKNSRPAMIKLKTTEEMEMECIAKMRKQTRQHIKANESSMKKAITSTSYHPVRVTTGMTQPQEFHFETEKRVKPHPMTTRSDDTSKEFLKTLRQHPQSPVRHSSLFHQLVERAHTHTHTVHAMVTLCIQSCHSYGNARSKKYKNVKYSNLKLTDFDF